MKIMKISTKSLLYILTKKEIIKVRISLKVVAILFLISLGLLLIPMFLTSLGLMKKEVAIYFLHSPLIWLWDNVTYTWSSPIIWIFCSAMASIMGVKALNLSISSPNPGLLKRIEKSFLLMAVFIFTFGLLQFLSWFLVPMQFFDAIDFHPVFLFEIIPLLEAPLFTLVLISVVLHSIQLLTERRQEGLSLK